MSNITFLYRLVTWLTAGKELPTMPLTADELAAGLPVDVGRIHLYRGDHRVFQFQLKTKTLVSDPDSSATPVDLTAYGTSWTSQIRLKPDSPDILAVPVLDTSALASGQITVTLSSAVWTSTNTGPLALANLKTGKLCYFDIQANSLTPTPELTTIWRGTFVIDSDTTRP